MNQITPEVAHNTIDALLYIPKKIGEVFLVGWYLLRLLTGEEAEIPDE